MLKKQLLFVTAFAATSFCSASVVAPSDEAAQKPNQIQKAAILLTGIQQDEWTPAGALTQWFPQAALFLAKKQHKNIQNFSSVASLGIMVGQRLADNRNISKSAFKGFKDFLLSHKAAFPRDLFQYSNGINQWLMAARYCYQAYEASEIIKEYKLSCKRIEMEHGIVKAVLPPDDSYIQINSPWGSFPRALWAIKRHCGLEVIPGFFAKSGKVDAMKKDLGPALITAFVIATYFYTQCVSHKTFIPKATLEMMAPELKERCEDLLYMQKNSFDPKYAYEVIESLWTYDPSQI